MGVYHLMGLGRSPGTVTGPLTYLAHRYQRWNADEQSFFARSDGTLASDEVPPRCLRAVLSHAKG